MNGDSISHSDDGCISGDSIYHSDDGCMSGDSISHSDNGVVEYAVASLDRLPGKKSFHMNPRIRYQYPCSDYQLIC